MIPIIAIVGRPNVGKSTLFNRLTKSRMALVADQPGLTRDRQYGESIFDGRPFIVVDTGGLGVSEHELDALITRQAMRAINEADAVILVVDGRAGLMPGDEVLANELRKIHKYIYLTVNKVDGIDVNSTLFDFYKIGLSTPFPISAEHGRGINALLDSVMQPFLTDDSVDELAKESHSIKIAFIGRPNVGKSTLVNRILGEDRVIVLDRPGTTRDSIYVPFNRRDRDYILIDTAGIRRRGRVDERVEKFSIIKAFKAIEEANVVVLMIDAREGIAEQDLRLLGLVLQAGRSLVIAVNKWDGMTQYEREHTKKELNRRLSFVSFADIHFISALHGTGVGTIFDSINAAYSSATCDLATPILTRILERAVEKHEPPLVHGRRIKLRYAHAGGHNPPTIVIHGKQTEHLPEGYCRYLEGFFRTELRLVGTPVRLALHSDDNPYAGRKNKLTTRQIKKKRRLMKFVKR